VIKLKVKNINFYDEAIGIVLMSIFHVYVENHVVLLRILRRKFQNTLDYSVVRYGISSGTPVTTYRRQCFV
jgi:hypothetical protein